MDWNVFVKELRALAKKIDFRPDAIVGIARGGLVPARLLSEFLNVKEMYCLTVKKSGSERKVVTEILDDLSGKNILLVEDLLESGRSLIAAKKYLEAKGALVKTACLYALPESEIKPDFFLKRAEGNTEISLGTELPEQILRSSIFSFSACLGENAASSRRAGGS